MRPHDFPWIRMPWGWRSLLVAIALFGGGLWSGSDSLVLAERSSPPAAQPDRPSKAEKQAAKEARQESRQEARPDGGGIGGGGGGGRPPQGPLTEEQIATVLQILREHNPALAQRLEEALEKYPDRAQRILTDQWPRLGRLLDLKQRDPKTFEATLTEIKLMGQARDLVAEWRTATKNGDTAQADQVKQQLIVLMGQMFDIGQQIRLREAERLEERAREIRQQVESRTGERDELIQRRLDEFLKRPASAFSPLPGGVAPPPPSSPPSPPSPSSSPPPAGNGSADSGQRPEPFGLAVAFVHPFLGERDFDCLEGGPPLRPIFSHGVHFPSFSLLPPYFSFSPLIP